MSQVQVCHATAPTTPSRSQTSILADGTQYRSTPSMKSSTSNATIRVFQDALQKHINRWKSDKRAFPAAGDSTPDDVIEEVKKYDEEHQKSAGRRYSKRYYCPKNFHLFHCCVSSNPEIAALVWGGVRFVIQVFSLNIIAPELINIIDSA